MIMSWEAKYETMRIYKYEAIHETYLMIAEMWKSTPNNTTAKSAKTAKSANTKQQNQNQPAIS